MAATTKKEHTATPWEVGSEGVSGGYANIYADGESILIAEVFSDDVDDEVAEANAEFLVTAVNAHADLLAACKAWMEFNRETAAENPCPDYAMRARLREKAKALTIAALAKAEEQS